MDTANPEVSITEKPGKVVTKETFRRRIWDHLVKNRLALFPGPYGRIPNFKGADLATQKLTELDEFINAKSVEVNPDKPLEAARKLVLESGKDLYVPIPQIEGSLLKKLELDGVNDIKKIVTRWGIDNTGIKIDINDVIHIDLLVLGSVAVSKDGYRIGKGQGFADLEFALLKEMNAINNNTVIVTIVHDVQVFDELPKDLFSKHDVPVDYILTPSTIIKIKNKLDRPEGIFWSLLPERRLKAIDVLQKLKEKHESEGKNTTLSTAVEPPVHYRRYGFNYRYIRFYRKKQKTQKQTDQITNDESENTNASSPKPEAKKEKRPRQLRSKKVNDATDTTNTENTENISPQKRKKKHRKSHIDYSLQVSNIGRNVRVRDLKNALIAKGIKPSNITWKGWRGYCYLHYAKKNKKNESVPEPFAIDNIIEIIQELKITPDSMKNLNVKVMEPITRIETMNITAV